MCNCIREWRQDESVKGSHNREPVTCEQYIRELQDQIERLMGIPPIVREPLEPRLPGVYLDAPEWVERIKRSLDG